MLVVSLGAVTTLGQVTLQEVYRSTVLEGSPDEGYYDDENNWVSVPYMSSMNQVGHIGVSVNGSHVAVNARGFWGVGNGHMYMYGTESGGAAPGSWTVMNMDPTFLDDFSNGRFGGPGPKLQLSATGLPLLAGVRYRNDTGDDTNYRVVWSDNLGAGSPWKYSDITTDVTTRRCINQRTSSFELLPSGRQGLVYLGDPTSNGWRYFEAEYNSGTDQWVKATSEIQLAATAMGNGVNTLVDPTNGRVRLFVPNWGMAAVTSGGSSSGRFQFPGYSDLTYAVRAAAGSDGRYYVVGVNDSGQVNLVDFEYDEAANDLASGTTAGQYYIDGSNSDPNWVTCPVVDYDDASGAVVVAYMKGVSNGDEGWWEGNDLGNGAAAVDLYVRIGERDGDGNLVFGDPVLIADNAARFRDTRGDYLSRPLDMKVVENPGGNSSLYLVYGEFDDDVVNGFNSKNVVVVKYTLLGGAVPGDTDGDGDVDLDDLFAVRNHFGTASGATRADGDTDGDGDVDLDDLFAVRNNFGTGVAPVPEPVTLSLLCAGAVCLLRRRR